MCVIISGGCYWYVVESSLYLHLVRADVELAENVAEEVLDFIPGIDAVWAVHNDHDVHEGLTLCHTREFPDSLWTFSLFCHIAKLSVLHWVPICFRIGLKLTLIAWFLKLLVIWPHPMFLIYWVSVYMVDNLDRCPVQAVLESISWRFLT